ncbi:MAG: pyrrolo-quinoline quinone [Planctomycetaceae bacterium TMED240]|nr:pyrrolo-quinoline quinone [Rhodopirellula sp.]OUX05220.1 MAG: pyrrolo-quinoline quinone [Planctomycetaceae bacterium TMED240]
MRRRLSQAFSKVLCIIPFLATTASAVDSWPQWRGEFQNGVASGDKFPTKWSQDQGIAWQAELPGLGGSTPVTADKTAYITSGVQGKNQLLAVDMETGKQKWTVSLGNDRGGKHRKGSGSNPSPVVDGDLIFAYFRSGDLASVDSSGKIRWSKNLQSLFGEDTLWWDLGSSPALTESAIVVAVMQSGPSYLVAFDKNTGEELWKFNRALNAPEEAAQSYSTPIVVSVKGEEAIAVMGADHLTINRARDGKLLGKLGGFNPNQEQYWRSISSPVADGNIILCPYARGDTLTAVNIDSLSDGKGKDAILWFRDDLGSDVPTPAAHMGRAYVVSDGKSSKGTVTCVNLTNGQSEWTVKLPKSRGGYSSSPLVAGNHLYVTQENGTTFVLGPLNEGQPTIISKNMIADDEPFTVASPIPYRESLLLRSRHKLYRITE